MPTDPEQPTIVEGDLFVSSEFAAALGDENLQGADVGDIRIDAAATLRDGSTDDLPGEISGIYDLEPGVIKCFGGYTSFKIRSTAKLKFGNDAEPFDVLF